MNRRGIALLLALLIVLLAAVLATTALASARLRWRAGQGVLAAAQATAATAASLESRQAAWDPVAAESLAIGMMVAAAPSFAAPGSLRLWDSTQRLGPALYQLRAVAERLDADGGVIARDGFVQLLQLLAPVVVDSAAVVASTAPTITPAASIDGDDHIPNGWTDCPPVLPSGPGVVLDPLPFARLTPVPPATLVPWASITLGGILSTPGPVVAGAVCTNLPLNWGGPLGGPCADRFPLVALQSGARVVDGMGQGIILALGNVELSGDFYFTGVILALGNIRFSGRAHLVGTLLAHGGVELADQARLERSTCASRRAAGWQRRIPGRVTHGWWRAP